MVNLVLPGACTAPILAHPPSVVIYAAASAAVDHAEAVEPAAMARASAELVIPMVHISTDYVFDGQGIAPFASDAAVVLLNAYGRTKAADEGRSDPRQLRTACVPAHQLGVFLPMAATSCAACRTWAPAARP